MKNDHPIFRFLQMALIASLCVDALSESSTHKKAPPVTGNVWQEAYLSLIYSQLVYGYGNLVNAARNGEIVLKGPDGNPIAEKFGKLDFRDPGYNNGDGVSFGSLFDFLDANQDVIEANFDPSFNRDIITGMKEYYKTPKGKGEENETFLSTYRNKQGKKACVYGVIKNRRTKTVIVVFRGSMSPKYNLDWRTNFNYRMKSMETPEKVKDKMKGRVQNRVLVHKGFYKYLFENDNMEDDYQRFDNIIDDIKPLMIEGGYSLYITGHSLGGALAHLFTFELAGAGEKYDWVPRPLTSITFGSPISGTRGYREAYEQMEKDNLIRCLRVVNVEDIIPAVSPFSFASLSNFRFMKHTGINLRLSRKGIFLEHSSKRGFFSAIRNSLFKPLWKFLPGLFGRPYPHSLDTYSGRMVEKKNREALSAMKLDDLYKDENYVSAKFLARKVSEYSSEE